MDHLNGERRGPFDNWALSCERYSEELLRRIKKRAETLQRQLNFESPRHPLSEQGAPMVAATQNETIHALEIRKEIFIAASPEIAFQAVLEELGPGSVLPDGKPFPMKIEPWPGGRGYRDLGEAGGHPSGHLWGHVQVIKAPMLLELIGPMPMSYPAINHVQYRLKAEGNGTQLSFVHRGMGLISQEHRDGMPEGWGHGMQRIKLVAEQRANNAR